MSDLRKKSAYWAELLAAGALGIFAGTVWQRRRTAAQAALPAMPPVPPALQNTAFPVSVDVTVAPHQNVTFPVDLGNIVIAWLPLGGKWVSLDGAGITDPVTPQAFHFQGPITHTYVWTDQSGATQTSIVNYVVAPPAGVVST